MQKSPRRSARKLLLVLALLLGIVTLSGCVASAPVTTSDPVGVGLGVTVRQLENVPLVITVKNNMDKFVSDIRVEIVAVDGKPGIAPFALWETPDASVSITAPLLPGKTAQVKLVLQQTEPAPIQSYPVDVQVTYKDGDGVEATEVVKSAAPFQH